MAPFSIIFVGEFCVTIYRQVIIDVNVLFFYYFCGEIQLSIK